MKKIIFTVIALSVAVAASAQTANRTSAEQRAKASTEQLRTTLSLSEQQYDKVYKAYLKMWRREDKRASQQKADRQATENTIKGLLNPEQAREFEQVKDRLQPKDDGRFTPRRTPLKREEKVIPLPRDPRRSNMIIEAE